MNSSATSINRSDQIFATLIIGGKVVSSVCKSNFSTIEEVVRYAYSIAGRFMGLARLIVRNKTQGWSMNMALAARHNMPRLATARRAQEHYYQASLFA